MTDETKKYAEALRRCGTAGVEICDGNKPNRVEQCAGCMNESKMASGNARGCFETWVQAADLLEALEKAKAEAERERDALRRDLKTVCDSINICAACGHYRTDWPKPGCELNGLACIWGWRGMKEGENGTCI